MPFSLTLSRRAFLRTSLAAAAVAPALRSNAASTNAPTALPAEAQGLTTYQLGPQIWVRWNNRLLTCYRAHPSQKFPYLYPLAGPVSGRSLTTETSLPYPHHRSIYFGCDRVNGGNYWQEGLNAGQIVSRGPSLGKGAKESVEVHDACDWRKPGGPVAMTDERKITVTVASPRLHWIDWEMRWTAVEPVKVLKTNHSLFALRAAGDLTPDGGGHLVNAEGQSGEPATFGRPSAWCAFYGRREDSRGNVVEGIALFDHPKNPWAPCPWFTRNYGFMSPTPLNFLEKGWELPAGQSVALRYRVVAFTGDPTEAGLKAIHQAWAG